MAEPTLTAPIASHARPIGLGAELPPPLPEAPRRALEENIFSTLSDVAHWLMPPDISLERLIDRAVMVWPEAM